MMVGFLRELEMVTPPQAKFLKSLVVEKVVPEKWEYEANLFRGEFWATAITKKQASDMITDLLAAPRVPKESSPARAAAKITEDGFYVRESDGVIFKIQKARDHDGLYGKMMGPVLSPKVEAADSPTGKMIPAEIDWVYVGAKALYLDLRKLTEDEARKYGALYGWCGICSRKLTKEESIERGIGPVCYGRMMEGM